MDAQKRMKDGMLDDKRKKRLKQQLRRKKSLSRLARLKGEEDGSCISLFLFSLFAPAMHLSRHVLVYFTLFKQVLLFSKLNSPPPAQTLNSWRACRSLAYVPRLLYLRKRNMLTGTQESGHVLVQIDDRWLRRRCQHPHAAQSDAHA